MKTDDHWSACAAHVRLSAHVKALYSLISLNYQEQIYLNMTKCPLSQFLGLHSYFQTKLYCIFTRWKRDINSTKHRLQSETQLNLCDNVTMCTRSMSWPLSYGEHWLTSRAVTYSGEFKLSPSVVRSLPRARWTMPGSVSAARMNVSSPIMPNWSVTIPEGMFVTRPAATAAAEWKKKQTNKKKPRTNPIIIFSRKQLATTCTVLC